ncbi:hypothetical protein WMF31_19940 [Sorangium sp. So ce1036]|uniref:hypothetical protein n=1 Tax=Sorangium sp. So ce1036 TaxID=3133328 RepID=UPI003F02EECA
MTRYAWSATEIDGEMNAYWYARNQPWTLVDPDGLIYSRILDRDGNVLTYVDEDGSTKPYTGRNPSEGGKVSPAGHISDKPYAEAVHSVACRLRSSRPA